MTRGFVAGDGPLTRYFRSLDAAGAPVDPEAFEKAWSALRGLLVSELRRRGLWGRSPSYVGVLGHRSWVGSGDRDLDALDELTADAYAFVFVRRLASLRAQLALKPNVDGIIRLNVRHLIHERQQRHDPLGTRIFGLLRAVCRAAVTAGDLVVSSGSDRIDSETVLATGEGVDRAPVEGASLAPIVSLWSQDLMPSLVTAHGRGVPILHRRLHEALVALPSQGVAAFRFRDLVDKLRTEVRGQWAAVLEQHFDLDSFEEVGEGANVRTRGVLPDEALESSDHLGRFVECVERSIVGRSGDDQDDLLALWRVLLDWSLERPAAGEDSSGLPAGDRPPSRQRIGEALDLPKRQLSELYEKLREVARGCRDEVDRVHGDRPAPDMVMKRPGSREAIKAQMRQATAQALASAEDSTTPPRAGDVFVLRATARWSIEWALLQVTPRGALAVPADTLPILGARDLAVRSTSAPVSVLRCGHACTVPTDLFEPALRTGRIEPATVERGLALARQGSASDAEPTEAEHDPLYIDWLEKAVRPAREAVEACRAREGPDDRRDFGRSSPSSQASRIWPIALAAAFGLVSIGLLSIIGSQARQLARLGQPQLDPAGSEVRFADQDRDPLNWHLPAGEDTLVVDLVGIEAGGCRRVTLSLQDAAGRERWNAQDIERYPAGRLRLLLPRTFLAGGVASFLVTATCGDTVTVLDQRPVKTVLD